MIYNDLDQAVNNFRNLRSKTRSGIFPDIEYALSEGLSIVMRPHPSYSIYLLKIKENDRNKYVRIGRIEEKPTFCGDGGIERWVLTEKRLERLDMQIITPIEAERKAREYLGSRMQKEEKEQIREAA